MHDQSIGAENFFGELRTLAEFRRADFEHGGAHVSTIGSFRRRSLRQQHGIIVFSPSGKLFFVGGFYLCGQQRSGGSGSNARAKIFGERGSLLSARKKNQSGLGAELSRAKRD